MQLSKFCLVFFFVLFTVSVKSGNCSYELNLRTNSPLQSVCNDINSIKYCILDVTIKDMEIQFYLQKTVSPNLLHS